MSSGEPMTDHTSGQPEPSAPSRGSVANHDAVPAAIAVSDEVRTDKAATSHRRDRSGNAPVAESATPDGYAYAGWPHPKEKMASISEAEIDALEFVVEEGRIASQMDYGVLRSLLVRLRPEWLDRPQPVIRGQSDRPKPIDGPDPDSRVWETHTLPTQTTQGEGSKPQDGTSEPVAWWVRGCEYDTGCEYEFVALLKEQAELAATQGGKAVPLYRSPTLTIAEREAVELAIDCMNGVEDISALWSQRETEAIATLRGLLERMK